MARVVQKKRDDLGFVAFVQNTLNSQNLYSFPYLPVTISIPNPQNKSLIDKIIRRSINPSISKTIGSDEHHQNTTPISVEIKFINDKNVQISPIDSSVEIQFSQIIFLPAQRIWPTNSNTTPQNTYTHYIVNGSSTLHDIQKLSKLTPNPLYAAIKEICGFDINVDVGKKAISIDKHPSISIDLLADGLKQLIIMLSAILNSENDAVILIDEPEIHLHAEWQRRLISYLKRTISERQYFIATHSSHIINAEGTNIFHFLNSTGNVHMKIIDTKNTSELFKICQDLGCRASDLFQANCIIWVEGPSDQIYIKHWIKQRWEYHKKQFKTKSIDPTLYPESLRMNTEYAIMWYGGANISHVNVDPPDPEHCNPIPQLVDLLSFNQNMAVVLDSDLPETLFPKDIQGILNRNGLNNLEGQLQEVEDQFKSLVQNKTPINDLISKVADLIEKSKDGVTKAEEKLEEQGKPKEDSDREQLHHFINQVKTLPAKLRNEKLPIIDRLNGTSMLWVTYGKEIENYIPTPVMAEAISRLYPRTRNDRYHPALVQELLCIRPHPRQESKLESKNLLRINAVSYYDRSPRFADYMSGIKEDDKKEKKIEKTNAAWMITAATKRDGQKIADASWLPYSQDIYYQQFINETQWSYTCHGDYIDDLHYIPHIAQLWKYMQLDESLDNIICVILHANGWGEIAEKINPTAPANEV